MLRAWEYDKSMIDDTTGAPRFHPKILNSPRADVHFENSRVRRRSASPSVMSTTSSQFSRRRGYRELMDVCLQGTDNKREQAHTRCTALWPTHTHTHTHVSSTHKQHLHQREPPPPRPDVSSECTFAPQTNPTSALIVCPDRKPRRAHTHVAPFPRPTPLSFFLPPHTSPTPLPHLSHTSPTPLPQLERCGSRPPLYPPVGYSEWREQSRSQTPAGYDPPPYEEGGDPAAQQGPQEKTPEERRLTKERVCRLAHTTTTATRRKVTTQPSPPPPTHTAQGVHGASGP